MAKGWLDALKGQKMEVQSARAGMAVQGWLDTGNYALNWAISGQFDKGYPLGHTAELFGDPGTGKSYLIARAIAMAQAAGGVALLDDTEHAYNLDHTANIGVDVDQLAYRHSRTVKDHLEVAQGFVAAYQGLKLKVPGVLACDSLSLLSTTHELEVQLDKRDMTKAAELRTFFRIMGGELAKHPIIHLSTSHTIANIGNIFNPRTTGGGGGPKFQSSVRIDLRGTSKIKVGTEFVGVIVRAFIEKNRVSPPWRQVEMAIPFDRPISRASGLVPVLLRLGVLGVTKNGRNLTYQGEDTGLPALKTRERFIRQDEAAEELLDQVPELLEEANRVAADQAALRADLDEATVSEDEGEETEG